MPGRRLAILLRKLNKLVRKSRWLRDRSLSHFKAFPFLEFKYRGFTSQICYFDLRSTVKLHLKRLQI